jgi:2-polyprenyl-3-methyl-5-hydroxy-6-metoxy-1,4-benzoquinol methylase
MAFKNCFICKGNAKSVVVVDKFDSRECGHSFCLKCKISHDQDVDEISTQTLTAEEIQNIQTKEEYTKLFVETPNVRDESGDDYGTFKWDDQKELRYGVSRHMIESIKRFNPEERPIKILDVGCASGFTSVSFAEAFPKASVTAVDPSPQVKGVDGFNNQIKAIQSTLQGYDFGDETFDVVVIIGNVMLHDNPFDTLTRAIDRLSPGGLLIFDFKNIRSSPRLLGIWAARMGVGKRLPKTLFQRNFLNMRFGYNEVFVKRFMANQNVEFVHRKSKPPRLLEFGNKSNFSTGWKGMLWRVLNRVDAIRGEQAWLQLEFIKQ